MSGEALERFIQAQEQGDPASYATALRELQAGRKKDHWIWYVVPQLKGLGSSRHSSFYGLDKIEEAKSYLLHPLLSERHAECLAVLLVRLQEGDQLKQVLGSTDAQKLLSSITLMRQALLAGAPNDSQQGLPRMIDTLFQLLAQHGYGPCRSTLQNLL